VDNIGVLLIRVRCTGEDFLNGRMDQSMRDSIRTTVKMEEEGIFQLKASPIREIG
jgi:hypothetical protein